jgi:sulfur-oxidizing protein SoxB
MKQSATDSYRSATSRNNRREFLKKITLAGLGLAGFNSIKAFNSRAILNGNAKHITILHTADIHAQLYTHDEFFLEDDKPVFKKRGGLGVLKTMLDSLREENPTNTILVDGGDCFQGSGVAALSQGTAIVPLINFIGYDLLLPGNWEVVYGKEMMLKDMSAYQGKKICANMFHSNSEGKKKDLIFSPYWIKNLGGVKIGFIGYNDPLTPKRQSPAYSEGICFTPLEFNLKMYIKLLKEKERCDLIFLVTHLGLAQQIDLSNQEMVQGVDYILGADTHERIRIPVQGKYCKVTEPGSFGSFVSKLDIVLEAGKIVDEQYQLLEVDPELFKPDKEMETMISKARNPYKTELNTVIGSTTSPLLRYYILENPMDNMITDAIMWKFQPDIALSNGFRFCPPLVPEPVSGTAIITNEFLWSMLPVDSEAKKAEISGQQLWNWLEKELHNVFAHDPMERFGGWLVRFAGMKINFTAGASFGHRLNEVRIKNELLDLHRQYAIVACEREGDPEHTLCREDRVKNPRKLGLHLHDVVREYLAKHSPIAPRFENRVTTTDTSRYLLSQLNDYGYKFY